MEIFSEKFFLLGCLALLLAFFVSWLQYSKTFHWTKPLNRLLFFFRFTIIFLIGLLLLDPFFSIKEDFIKKPKIFFVMDNSRSMHFLSDSTFLVNFIAEAKNSILSLSDVGYQIFNRDLEDFVVEMAPSFPKKITNLTASLEDIETTYRDENIAGVVLLSDGGHNFGKSPVSTRFSFPIFTIGIGDTLQKKDILLKHIYTNKISYLGNRVPIVAEVINKGFQSQKTEVLLLHKNRVVSKKEISFQQPNQIQNIEFYWDTQQIGITHLRVVVKGVKGETTLSNNSEDVYIRCIKGSKKILLVSMAPHPDIGALKRLIEKHKNISMDLVMLSHPNKNRMEIGDLSMYHLVIFHQIPNLKNIGGEWLNRINTSNLPIFFLMGSLSDIAQINRMQKMLFIENMQGGRDGVTAIFNPNFDAFPFLESQRQKMNNYPPLWVPFGELQTYKKTDVILQQQIGSINTTLPLLVTQDLNGVKKGLLIGEGIWRWSLTSERDGNESFQTLFFKILQYLMLKDRERIFLVQPIKKDFLDMENVEFETELFNETFEPIFGQKIQLTIADKDTILYSFEYVNDFATTYSIGTLPQGIYNYRAKTKLNGKPIQSNGSFYVQPVDLEEKTLSADFDLLRKIATESKGKFYYAQQFPFLIDDLKENKKNNTISQIETQLSVIHINILFYLFIGLICLEWFLRKIGGSY